MLQRYFLIEPLYNDGDTFCSFTIGSGRVRANIHIYADSGMLQDVLWALTCEHLTEEFPKMVTDDIWFGLHISVIPEKDGTRSVRFQIFQTMLDDRARFSSDITFETSKEDAQELAADLDNWLKKENFCLIWKPD